jgi:hypothetical protein
LLNEDLLNVVADEGPVVNDIVLETEVDGLEEDADGMIDEVDTGLVMEDKAWVPPRLSGSYIQRMMSPVQGIGNNHHRSLL